MLDLADTLLAHRDSVLYKQVYWIEGIIEMKDSDKFKIFYSQVIFGNGKGDSKDENNEIWQ